MQDPTEPLLSATQASQLLDVVVVERVRELFDLEGLLNFEQELWYALVDCGLPREEVPKISAGMIARAFTRLGEDHLELATNDRVEERSGQRSKPTKTLT